MGKSVVVLGTQWGDEGKGKIVDLLTDQATAGVRYHGRLFFTLFHLVFCVKMYCA